MSTQTMSHQSLGLLAIVAALSGCLGSALTWVVVGSVASSEPLRPEVHYRTDAALVSTVEELVDRVGMWVEREALLAPETRQAVADEPADSNAEAQADWTILTQSIDRLRESLDRLAASSGQANIAPEAWKQPVQVGAFEVLAKEKERMPSIQKNSVPLQYFTLGLHGIIQHFGWPDSYIVPTNPNGTYTLTYNRSIQGSSLGSVSFRCTEDRVLAMYVN